MYGSCDNCTKVSTKPRLTKRAKHEIQSSSIFSYDSSEEIDDDANDSYYIKEEKIKSI